MTTRTDDEASPPVDRARAPRAAASSMTGARLGPYRILRPLGVGGMATVFAAEHVGLQKRVAVKVLREQLALDDDVRRRFVREGVLASRVRHPHVVDVTDVGEDEGRSYLVMEYLEGECLGARMARRGPLPVGEALTMMLPIVCGLGAAHRAGVVHRDVKPENIFLARDADGHETSKLLDFGISRLDRLGLDRITDSRIVLGTVHYMAPEQARGGPIDARADQYALAVVLFEAISGTLPYVAGCTNVMDMMAEAARGNTRPLVERWPGAPKELSDVLAKALASARDDRYASMEELGRALLPFAPPRATRRFRELTDPGWTRTGEREAEPVERSGAPVRPPDPLRAEAPTVSATLDARMARSDAGQPAETSSKPANDPMPSAPSREVAPLRAASSSGPPYALALAVVLITATIGLAASATRDAGEAPPIVAAGPPAPIARPAEIVVSLRVLPPEAVISLDGRPVDVGSLRLSLPRGARAHHLVVDAVGFVPWESFVGDADLDRSLVLARDPVP
jgi:serine/threonine protein kinase